MNAIRQIVEVKNHKINVVLPNDFSAKKVEVIIFSSDEDIEISTLQMEETEKRYKEFKKNPEIALNNFDFMEKLDALK